MPKVLIVDDKEANRFVLTNFIKLFGSSVTIEIIEASSGVEAYKQLCEMTEKPDLVLMDIKMESDNAGIVTVKSIRENQDLKDLTVWAITAQAMEGSDVTLSDRDKCLGAGFNDYVSKPFDLSILLRKISQFLSLEIPENIKHKMGIVD